MTTIATIDLAGGQIGGAARFRAEVRGYLKRSARDDIRMIGAGRNLTPGWLAAREAAAVRKSRRVALNNVGFARDTPQNQEIVGPAPCGYTVGAPDSLMHAIKTALEGGIATDPGSFDPDSYFEWLLGRSR